MRRFAGIRSSLSHQRAAPPAMPGSDLLEFNSGGLKAKKSRCPVCGRSASRIALSIRDEQSRKLMLSCSCGSLFYPESHALDYELAEGRDSFFMRIDQAESISASSRPLFVSPSLANYAVVDVGCGVGFTSDFVRFTGRECEAFDPSSAARMSTEILGIQIHQEIATPDRVTVGHPRLVFASEVIEHVDHPREFLATLRAIAGDTGYVVVTTPNADYVRRESPTEVVLAILAPGQHLFLLSKQSLKRLAAEAGFPWVHTWTEDSRLFMMGGPRTISTTGSYPQSAYLQYLAQRLETADEIELAIRVRAFGYRLFKEYVNLGRYEEAEGLFADLAATYATLGLDLSKPEDVVARYRRAAGPDKSLPSTEAFPYNTALILFHKGTLEIAHHQDRNSARPYFYASIELAELYREIFSVGIFQAYDLELQAVRSWAMAAIQQHEL
jgi:2-polyprenyl-3-methyl-5-hydroxy-6-metoxy-1,4-benzoquinol methylase